MGTPITQGIVLRFNKVQLLEALEALRPQAVDADRKNKAEHQLREKEFLKRLKVAARAALKWDYLTAKKHDFRIGVIDANGNRLYGPSCPSSHVEALERCISIVSMTSQTKFLLSERGVHRYVYATLTRYAPQHKGLC